MKDLMNAINITKLTDSDNIISDYKAMVEKHSSSLSSRYFENYSVYCATIVYDKIFKNTNKSISIFTGGFYTKYTKQGVNFFYNRIRESLIDAAIRINKACGIRIVTCELDKPAVSKFKKLIKLLNTEINKRRNDNRVGNVLEYIPAKNATGDPRKLLHYVVADGRMVRIEKSHTETDVKDGLVPALVCFNDPNESKKLLEDFDKIWQKLN